MAFSATDSLRDSSSIFIRWLRPSATGAARAATAAPQPITARLPAPNTEVSRMPSMAKVRIGLAPAISISAEARTEWLTA